MEIFLKFLAGLAAVAGFFMTTLSLPGNTLLLLLFVGYAFFSNYTVVGLEQLAVVALLYLAGELWEFVVGYLGIKKENLTWLGVLIVGLGAFLGAMAGLTLVPVIGSVIGSAVGAFVSAFFVGYFSGGSQRGFRLAFVAARNQFLAIIGKVIVGVVLLIMFVRLLFI